MWESREQGYGTGTCRLVSNIFGCGYIRRCGKCLTARLLLPGLQALALEIVLITILQILRPISRQIHPGVVGVDEFFLIEVPDCEFEVFAGAADHALQLDEVNAGVLRVDTAFRIKSL